MKPKRLILTIIAVFVALWATDFLIHGVWLASTYKATMNLWRSDSEMQARMGWLFLGQFLAAFVFVVVWSKGFPATASAGGACLYGVLMGLFLQSNSLITYAVQPLPPSLTVKWICSGLVQGALLGIITFLVYRPSKAKALSG